MTFYEQIAHIPVGYSEAIYLGRRYGVSRTDFNGGRSIKIYGRELGGADFISFNLYRARSGEIFKPCEMPRDKVLAFIAGMQYSPEA